MTELKNDSCIGQIEIADEVIAVIAGTAATEVDGVAMTGNLTRDIAERFVKKNLSKGVSVIVEDKNVIVQLNLLIKMGYKIKDVTVEVQEKVKTAIETMTAFNVAEVNIYVTGIYVGKEKTQREKKAVE